MIFDTLRMCRVDGAQPTTRERWTAFHRLWRIAERSSPPFHGFEDCFRVLMHDWKWIILMNETGDVYAINPFMPRTVRWSTARMMKSKRLGVTIPKFPQEQWV